MRKNLTFHDQKTWEEHFAADHDPGITGLSREGWQEMEEIDTSGEIGEDGLPEPEDMPDAGQAWMFRLQAVLDDFRLVLTIFLAVLGIITLAVPVLRECFITLIRSFFLEAGFGL